MQKINNYISSDINLNYLSCSLYTLFTIRRIFGNRFFEMGSLHFFSTRENKISELYEFLDKDSLKRFAYDLIKPLLKLNASLVISETENTFQTKKNCNGSALLKKYLTRFRYNYRRHFFSQSEHYETLPSKKEINMIAISLLFILAGI